MVVVVVVAGNVGEGFLVGGCWEEGKHRYGGCGEGWRF